jgi:hypothetical protein
MIPALGKCIIVVMICVSKIRALLRRMDAREVHNQIMA